VLRISVDNIPEKCLTIKSPQSRRHLGEYLTDFDFADDLALTAESVKDLLHALELAASQIGLQMREKLNLLAPKLTFMTSSQSKNSI